MLEQSPTKQALTSAGEARRQASPAAVGRWVSAKRSPERGHVFHASEAPGVEAIEPRRAVALLPADLLHDDEVIILLLRPSILFVPLSCMTSLAFIALIAFFLAYLARWQPWIGWTDTQAFALGIGLAALRLAWQVAEWLTRIYVLTDRRIVTRVGVLRVSVFQCELRRIQHTSVVTRVRERVFGVGSIGFATAGSDVFETFWVTLRQPFAVHKIVVQAIKRYGRGPGR
jgi:membrane protein YdbS with pleckstrin-like domain